MELFFTLVSVLLFVGGADYSTARLNTNEKSLWGGGAVSEDVP